MSRVTNQVLCLINRNASGTNIKSLPLGYGLGMERPRSLPLLRVSYPCRSDCDVY
jgi:hypothetical protein